MQLIQPQPEPSPITCNRPSRRRLPPWWAVLLIQAAGLCIAVVAFVATALALPRYGLFSAENDFETRLTGAVAAFVTGVGVASGALFVGAVRRDRRWVTAGLAVAGGIGVLLLAGILLTDA